MVFKISSFYIKYPSDIIIFKYWIMNYTYRIKCDLSKDMNH